MSNDKTWEEYRELVLFQLEESQRMHKDIGLEIRQLRDDVLMLKVKAGMWGAMASVGVSILIGFITHLLTK
jgi:hypothetical protein